MYNPYAGGTGVQFVQAPSNGNNIGIGGPTPAQAMDAGRTVAVDGTPIRVVVIAFAAAAGVFAFKMAGIKFNVGVSTS